MDMNTELHLFDLDFTLWKTNSKMAIINKNKPEQVLFRLDLSDKSLMKSYWRSDNLPMNYNGQTYFLSNAIWKRIKSENPGLDLQISDLGVSFREWTEEEDINKQIKNTEYLLSNLDHLVGVHNINLGIVTARTDKDEHKKVLNLLFDKIYTKLKVKVNRVYFVNDINGISSKPTDLSNDDSTANKKVQILLEHLTGYKIVNNRFINTEQTKYNTVSFYDDNSKNIETAKNIQHILELCLDRSKPEIKREIITRISNTDNLCLKIYQITNNKVNPFIKTEHIISVPRNFRVFK